ncbi:MAG: Gfo/Idh/MocA family protein [Candidatus Bipolaricaulia bacterium]
MEYAGIGVIGTGLMGSVHAKVYAQLPNAHLVAIADVNQERLERVSEALGVQGFTDYNELLERKDIDAVSICVPDHLHRDPTIVAADQGKHILLEKPIATNLEDAQAIIAACQRNGVKLMVGHLLRFDPRYANVKEAIDRGDLGEIIHISAHRNSPVTEGPARYAPGTSLTLHVVVHDLDLIHWYANSQPVRVYAERVREILKEKEMDDAISALLKFESGMVANLEYSWALPEKFPTKLDARMEIIGTKGAAYIGAYPEQGMFIVDHEGISSPDIYHWPEVRGKLQGDVREELIQFTDCVLADQDPPVTGEEALQAVRLALSIEQSIEAGKPISM